MHWLLDLHVTQFAHKYGFGPFFRGGISTRVRESTRAETPVKLYSASLHGLAQGNAIHQFDIIACTTRVYLRESMDSRKNLLRESTWTRVVNYEIPPLFFPITVLNYIDFFPPKYDWIELIKKISCSRDVYYRCNSISVNLREKREKC
jgi:hypothetical protein